MIKNAICYKFMGEKLELPEVIEPSFLEHKPTANQVSTIGLAKHELFNTHVTPFNGGFCLTIKKWEKKIDSAALNACLSDLICAFEDNNGRSITKKEKEQLKENLVLELLPKILPTPKIMHLYYDAATKIIITDSVVSGFCESALALLRKIIGTLPVELMLVDGDNFTTQVSEKLNNGNVQLNDTFIIEDSLELTGDKCKVKFDGVSLLDESTVDEIVAQINEGGMYVKSILLNHDNLGVKFKLVDDHKLTHIKSEKQPEDGDDVLHNWRVETQLSVVRIKNTIGSLVIYFNPNGN